MEALNQLVADSLVRHGLDRPIDPRRLQWSRWFRCDSPRSLLIVPSKPGLFAIAEEIINFGTGTLHRGADALVRPAEQSSAGASSAATSLDATNGASLGSYPSADAALQRSDPQPPGKAASATEEPRRMLAVLQFSEDDDMAFVLDRMFTRENPLRARLTSGNCFLRFVVIEDRAQRRSICHALNQWLLTSAEKATGLPQDFSSSLEMTAEHVGGTPLPARGEGGEKPMRLITSEANSAAVQLNSGSTSNLHCPQPLPSGF